MGFTPPEWAYLTTELTGVDISQGAARTIDRKIRLAPFKPLPSSGMTGQRINALIRAACQLIRDGAPNVAPHQFHRLDKADTKSGLNSVQGLATMGVPYAMVLYERFLGRPFAAHRDSVSELVGDILESAIESVLSKAGVSYRRTGRAESISGFEQVPDFIVPSEFNPEVIIEAKLTEDDGTARDKISRIQALCQMSLKGRSPENPRFHVIACIAGRGFKVRREDMKKLLRYTRGKVFTLRNLSKLIEFTELTKFATRR